MIVGINAEAGSGKSTVADSLGAQYGFVSVALADEMKRICQRVYGFSRDQLWGPSELRSRPDERYKRMCKVCHGSGRDDRSTLSVPPCYACGGSGFTYLTARQALQELGDWGRAMYKDTWVDVTLRDIEALQGTEVVKYAPWYGVYEAFDEEPHTPYTRFIIPDVRYKNEMAALQIKGAKLIRIKGVHQPMPDEFAGHSSEQEQKNIPDDAFDAIIVNDSDIPTLVRRVRSAIGL